MKYAFFSLYSIISGTNPPQFNKYKVPIITSDRVYNLVPAPGDPDYLLASGDENGYNSIPDLYKSVCDALTFNPFTITGYFINDAAKDIPLYKDMIEGFGGEFEINNSGFAVAYPEEWTQESIVGYFDLTVESARGTNSLTGTSLFNWIFGSLINPYREVNPDDGLIYRFEVWPESSIEDGVLKFDHFFKHDNKIRDCITKLYIYENENKYYWYIKLENVTFNENETNSLLTRFQGAELDHVYEPDNPYDNHQSDGTEGGNGGFDNDSDPVDVPPLPDLDITELGGLKLYKCTPADLANVLSYLASHDPGASIVKWFSNPIQGITAAYILPYPVNVTGAANITVLGINVGSGNAYTAKQWQEWNLGSVLCDYGFGNCFLDYAPYTKVSIYLPFIGIRELNTDEVIGKSIGVHYQFDNISGACIAFIKVGSSVRYTFTGSCAVGIPLSQSNWGQLYIGAATAAAAVLGGAAAGIGAGIASGTETAGLGQMALGGAAKQAGGALSSVLQKPTISRSGSVSGAASTLGVNYPYLIIVRPDKAKVSNPAPVTGITCGRTLSLGSLSGYNIIEHVHLHGIAATGPELEEIERLLYEGVIF